MEKIKILYESGDSVYYLGRHDIYPGNLIFKTFRNNQAYSNRLKRFQNELDITKNLQIDGIRRALAIEDDKEGNPVLILEYIEGKSIKDILLEKKLGIHTLLRMAQSLALILHKVHEQNIIHKDIHNRNIIIGKDDNPYLIDFGISTKLNLKSQHFLHPGQLEGNLAYISPEQTGRMNRYIDYRTDFYSLGISFYEMFSGKLPFMSDDPVELVYSHIARFPEPLHEVNPEVPEMVSKIIHKLLSKNAEDRYQSALGINQDLVVCIRSWEEKGEIGSFVLGGKDFSGKFQIPQKLYGRENEIQNLLGAFNNLSQGDSEFMVISGYSGVGKTTLVHEIHKPVAQARGYYLEGKFDQFQRNSPYTPFQQAFTEFFNHILAGNTESLELWKNRLEKALGYNAGVLSELIPNLEKVLGEFKAVPEVSSSEMQLRFNYEFLNLIKSMATEKSPLVLFLDDMQWADSASLNLLVQLITEGLPHFMVIASYRDNEVSEQHPWMISLSQIEKVKREIKTIRLKGLELKDVHQLIADTLNLPLKDTLKLSEYINQKTKGNPFFLGQFLKTLYAENVIFWNSAISKWEWKEEEIAAKDVTENVVHFLSEQMESLNPTTLFILQRASCIGNRFGVQLLSLISDISLADIQKALYESIQEGYVLPNFQENRKMDAMDTGGLNEEVFKFTHDRVQQALHSGIEPVENSQIHYKIGRYLLEKSDRNTEIFKIAQHLNIAANLIQEPTAKKELSRLNYEAGVKARNNNAHETALGFFKNTLALLNEDEWKSDFEFMFNGMLSTSEEEYINRNEKEAEIIIQQVYDKCRTSLEKARVLEKKVLLYAHLGRLKEGLEIGREALGLLGVKLPKKNFPKKLGILKQLLFANWAMKGKTEEYILSLPVLNSPKGKLLTSLVGFLFMTLYYVDPESFIFMALYMANYSLKNGNSTLSPVAYVSLAIVQAAFFKKYQEAYDLSQISFRLNQKFINGTVKGRVMLNFYGGISHWVKPVDESIHQLYEGYKVCMENGDLPYAIDTLIVNLSIQIYRGRNLKGILDEFNVFGPFIWEAKDPKQHYDFLGQITFIKNLIQNEQSVVELEKFTEEYLRKNTNAFTRAYFFILQGFFNILIGNAQKALEYTGEGAKLIDGFKASILEPEQILFHALAWACQEKDFSLSHSKAVKLHLKKAIKQYQLWSNYCPENFAPGRALLEAELERVEYGKNVNALYKEAISLSRKSKFIHLEAFSLERLGLYCLDSQLDEAAFYYLKESSHLYNRWGANLKVNILREKYPQIKGFTQNFVSDSLGDYPELSIHSGGSLDMMSVLKASTALAKEIKIERLLHVLMQIILENVGAQTGYFILVQENKFLFSDAKSKKDEILEDIRFLTPDRIPDSMVQFVKRTHENLVVEDSKKDFRFSSDPYFDKNDARSILCVPILSKNEPIAIIYLENHSTLGAFTKDRIELLKLLSGQISVSLQNSLLYSNLEQKVNDRTEEVVRQKDVLETTLRDLKSTQSQLIQSEKMASLGELTAGIAHEIQNPLNFVNNFSEINLVLINELRAALDLGDDKEVQSLIQTLSENETKINHHGSRADSIVKGMLLHSRKSQNIKELTDINELIKENLRLSYHGLRAKSHEFHAMIEADYDPNIGKINIIPQDIGRVLLNLFNNAIYSVSEKKKIHPNGYEPKVWVKTKSGKDHCTLWIRDNGMGIPEKIIDKIFQPFFTTKPTGQGTGIGLSLSYDIIKAHNGEIKVSSFPTLQEGAEFILILPLS